ncbi:uncharacterized protein LOC110825790 isoform X2 [Carica papaya]|uniref:uncharacterized protein LOC110825790 isoform X2 n=1 Tax=Carica papaya TaxID=3649 RepID=UPI000B8D05C5|nr:uncharacterized protein LOC110825790 isoform X2 [Carica papaya]
MLRLCFTPRRYSKHNLLRRSFSSKNSVQTLHNLNNSHSVSPQPPTCPPIPQNHLYPQPPTTTATTSFLSRNSVFLFSATIFSALFATFTFLPPDKPPQNDRPDSNPNFNPISTAISHTIYKSNDSFQRILHHVKQTGLAASVLWQSLRSVLSSANQEVRSGFELRVAALLADIAAANAARRAAIVRAGGGAVVDWLLETVAVLGDGCGTQAEAARALAYLIADPIVSKDVLGRPHAVPNLLRFIFSCQPNKKKHSRRSSLDVSDSLKGRSMLVAAIMDIVTSNFESSEKFSFNSLLPENAEMGDIASAIEVIEEGGMHLDEPHNNEDDDDGGSGIRGIGIKILEGTTVIGLSRTSGFMELGDSDAGLVEHTPKTVSLLSKHDPSLSRRNLSSAVVPGLWDDLHCQHVAVPFATWALANWAMASTTNRSHIQELDKDGYAVMTALVAPERSVKWHGSLVARLLLEDRNLPLSDSVSDWSSILLSTVSHASKNEDFSLAQAALSAFLIAVDRSAEAQKMVMEKGLHLMRDIAKQTTKHKHLQEALAKALEFLCTGNMHLSLEEGQKWSGILLPWVFGKHSSYTIQCSAIRILSCILEDYGPSAVPISQGWLAILLNESLHSSNASSVKSEIAKTANQLAGAVVNLAAAQLGTTTDSVDTFPLADLLYLEPFSVPFKNLKKVTSLKFDVADSALATLKGIKALTEVCAEDSSCQNRIADFGVLCLLRRFLLSDDYEKLAAMEAYDASRILETQGSPSNNLGESSSATNDPSSIRVPPTAHIRRHAARLLTILSVLPKVQKVIVADETWCRWLEDCANGKIQGCSDLKIQSYARAILLNVFCSQENNGNSENDGNPETGTSNGSRVCPRYGDMIFLINPELPQWKYFLKTDQASSRKNGSSLSDVESANGEEATANTASSISNFSSPGDLPQSATVSEVPLLDVVFVHGLRGGPYKTWRISEDKYSTKSGLVEKIDQEAGKLGTFWPGEWLSGDLPQARLFTLKYKLS